jgi:hypothetical protein
VGLAATLLLASDARAYRPFDGTDADVVEARRFELEAGPLGYLHEEGQRYLVAPALVGNYGVAPGWELVLEGRNELAYGERAIGQRLRVVDTALSLKGIMRRGALQGADGPSVALEPGLLAPAVGDVPGLGGIVTGIVSFHSEIGSVHLNGAQLLTRGHALAWFTSVIVEGPDSWTARPVAEVLATASYRLPSASAIERTALLGAIVSVDDDWTLDAAVRAGWSEGLPLQEVRLGFTLTWGTPAASEAPEGARHSATSPSPDPSP